MLANAGQNQIGINQPRNLRSATSHRSGKSTKRSGLNQTYENQLSQMSSNTTMPPSIPGKSQRILINKKQPFSASTAASRCFKRGGSQNKTGAKGSIYGVSSLSTQSSFSSFSHASMKVQREHQFGNKQRRFDAKIEL